MPAGRAMTGCSLRIDFPCLRPPLKSPAVATTPAALPPESALLALRAATHSRHRAIEQVMDLRRLRDPAHYARVLQVFDAFLGPWENAVAAALPPARRDWLRARSRRPFLQDDLRVLALRAHAASLPQLPIATPAAAWGSLYVLEGSALGGQAITRALAPAGLRPGAGASYFHGWGEATGRMWQEFRALLETELAQPACLAAACEAACHTFDALSASLAERLHEPSGPPQGRIPQCAARRFAQ